MSILSANSPYFQAGAGANGDEGFADPFNDIATTQMPTTMKSALWWSEYIWTVMGTYRMAMERIVSYFITDVELGGDASDDEKDKYQDFLGEQLDALSFLGLMMRDRLCYGNAFASVVVPFRRYLQCPKTGDLYPLKIVYYNFNFQFNDKFEFIATCPKTGWRGAWHVIDKPREESDHLILKRWNPHEMELLHDPYTDEVAYLWRVPEYYKRMIKEGNLYHLERASRQVLEAIKHDKLFRFNPDAIYHMKEQTLAGIRNMGWGLPRSLVNYRQIWYVQVLRRYNEAIALDYIIPFRLITPEARSGGQSGLGTQDPMSVYNAGDFRSQIRHMLNKRRRDPASWQMLPFPVNYQMLGGDANQLAPTELITQGFDTLLNETGTPVEFYNGSLSMQAAPVALRLFESTHRQLVSDANNFLQWMCNTVSRVMSWEIVDCKLKRVTLADDIAKQTTALQLMMGQQLSGTSGLAAIGYDWETEQKRLADEARKQQEMAARQAEEAEQAGLAQQIAKGQPAGGGMPPGGDPAAAGAGGDPAAAAGGGGGDPAAAGGGPGMAAQGGMPVSDYIQSMGPNANVTPNDLQSAAEMIAQELLGLPEGTKDSQLRELKKHNPTLHAIVKEKMNDTRQAARQQGGDQLLQQQFGGGGQPGAPM
jgi:hypothetical protein